VIELVELVLERGNFRFQFRDESVHDGLLELRDIFDFVSRLRVVTGFLEDAVTHVERLEERDEALQFRAQNARRILDLAAEYRIPLEMLWRPGGGTNATTAVGETEATDS
jgi:hypothetical protein